MVAQLTFFLAPLALAEEPAAIHDMIAQPDLVDWLSTIGMTELAYLEVMREAMRDPSHARALEARAGALLWQDGEYDLAAQHFAALGDAPDARLGHAYSLVQLRLYRPALDVLSETQDPTSIYLRGLASLRVANDEEAISALNSIGSDPVLGGHAAALSAGISALGPLRHRSPLAAGLLSAALPGAGQAYVGRWGEAVSAFFVNAAFVGAGLELARRDLWFGLGVVSLFEVSFYGGNIMSAVGSARRFNRKEPERRAEALLSEHDLVLEAGPEGLSPLLPGAP